VKGFDEAPQSAEDPLRGIERARGTRVRARRGAGLRARRLGLLLGLLADDGRTRRDRGARGGDADRLGHLGLFAPQLLLVVARAEATGARGIGATLDAAGLGLAA